MKNDVFINRLSPYLPNNPVNNDEMEDYLGLIEGKASRVKRIVLRQNGINTRYYALNKKQEITPMPSKDYSNLKRSWEQLNFCLLQLLFLIRFFLPMLQWYMVC